MKLAPVDLLLIFAFFGVLLTIGFRASRKAGSSSTQFFLSGRAMPWWLLGISMVATTFSADTPNLVTNIVRQQGVYGNWVWWAFLLTGMLTVFVYAKLWRRSGVMTDLEFYELRYSGKTAAFLRGFRAIYLGVFFNIVVIASVCLAAIKISGVLLDLSPVTTLLISAFIIVFYTALGGLRGVLLTDLVQFAIAMVGAVWAAKVVLGLPQVGGLQGLLTHENVRDRLSLFPDFSNIEMMIPVFLIPIAVQWWSVWYPGAEPGGGGYVVQRMLSAKSERHAVGATLLFNVAHYALRPWPWILVALCSLIVFPDLDSLQTAFPNLDPSRVKDDLAYSAMLIHLPQGLLGLVVASLMAAFMSTVASHLNWGASYVVNDFYKRFITPEASERRLVYIGRLATVLLMVAAGSLALLLESALQAFHVLLQIGAGTGLLFILRWFWWRINPISEMVAMIVSFSVALYFVVHHHLGLPRISDSVQLCSGVAITTLAWVAATLLTKPSDSATLRSFYRLVKPGGPGWRRVITEAREDDDPIDDGEGWDLPQGLLCMFLGCLTVYSFLFAMGYWIYGNHVPATILTVVAILGTTSLMKAWASLRTH